MKINIKTKTGAKQEKVLQTSDYEYEVCVKQQPIEGKANEAVINLLAKHFKLTKSKIILIRGAKSKLKTFEIKD